MAEKINYTKYSKPSDFIKLVEGTNVIRIVGDGYMANIYGMRAKGRWIRFGETVPPETMAKFKNNISIKRCWQWVALNRLTGTVGLLEVGVTIGDAICALAAEKQMNPDQFDIEIKRTGMGTSSEYKVLPMPETKPIPTELQARITREKQYILDKYINK